MSDQPPPPDGQSRTDQAAVQREALALLARAILPLAGIGSGGASLGPVWLVGLVALIVGLVLAPDEASKEFYSAVAGVIPVLLLTLAVQARFFELPTWSEVRERFELSRKPGEHWLLHYLRVWADTFVGAKARWRFVERILFGLALLALLVIGEFAALHPLAEGQPRAGNPQLVYAALTAGFAMVAALSLLGGIEAGAVRNKRGSKLS